MKKRPLRLFALLLAACLLASGLALAEDTPETAEVVEAVETLAGAPAEEPA